MSLGQASKSPFQCLHLFSKGTCTDENLAHRDSSYVGVLISYCSVSFNVSISLDNRGFILFSSFSRYRDVPFLRLCASFCAFQYCLQKPPYYRGREILVDTKHAQKKKFSKNASKRLQFTLKYWVTQVSVSCVCNICWFLREIVSLLWRNSFKKRNLFTFDITWLSVNPENSAAQMLVACHVVWDAILQRADPRSIRNSRRAIVRLFVRGVFCFCEGSQGRKMKHVCHFINWVRNYPPSIVQVIGKKKEIKSP